MDHPQLRVEGENDKFPLIQHASDSTQAALEKGATFSERDRSKADLHVWLAWQEEPGQTYGRAVAKRYFQHHAQLATSFVDWFRRLYGIDVQNEY